MIGLLEKDGWYQVGQKGSHRQYKHAVKTGKVTVSGSSNADLAAGTLKSIFRQAGLESQ
ncbi:MAG: type II toxin-antitoxin system HicA family toxin [SAR324 cluster bacterium]|nr:type II toxin-antitoxin system HicA family toxin [SAR324 cluster bacterium]